MGIFLHEIDLEIITEIFAYHFSPNITIIYHLKSQ